MNGGEIHVVLSLALKMCAEQDTEVLLRSRRMRRTEFLCMEVGEEGMQGGNCLVVEVAKGANFDCF